MRGTGGEVEARAFAGEDHVLGAHRNVEAVHTGEREGLAVDGDGAACFADIDDRQLAPLEEGSAGGGGRLCLVR